MSNSNINNYRMEGGGNYKNKNKRMKASSSKIINYILEDTYEYIIDEINFKLENLLKLLEKNYKIASGEINGKYVWDTVGTSLFIAHDNKKSVVKLIDFNHAEIHSVKYIDNKIVKLSYNIYEGLNSFIYDFNRS